MRARILRGSADPAFDSDSKTALIATLLKLGQEPFVREYKSYFAANAPANFESWLEAVFSGKGSNAAWPQQLHVDGLERLACNQALAGVG